MFEGKRRLIAKVLHHSNLLRVCRRMIVKRRLIVFNYHRIRPDEPMSPPPFDESLYSVSASHFVKQIEWLKQNSRVISENRLIEIMKSGKPPSEPCVLITFDDAYREHYSIAYPVLKSMNVPAIFFVSSHMIDTRQLGWWDIIAYLLRKSPKASIVFEDRSFDLKNEPDRAAHYFCQKMKLEAYDRTKNLLRDLSEACEVDYPPIDLQSEHLMTWDQIRALSDNDFSIGSHGHTHRVLSTLLPIHQREEMLLSKFILEQSTGKEIRSIAYPVGEAGHFTEETQIAARECGFELGFSCHFGSNEWGGLNPFAMKRVGWPLDDISDVSVFATIPQVYLWEKPASAHKCASTKPPDFLDVYYRLGVTYLSRKKTREAIGAFSQALRINPDYVEARIKLGISQAHLGLFEAAVASFKRVMETRPFYPDVHFYLAAAYAGCNETDRAIECFQHAVALNPGCKDAWIGLGILNCNLGELGRGMQWLEKASRLDPDDGDLGIAIKVLRERITSCKCSQSNIMELLHCVLNVEEQLTLSVRNLHKHVEISPNLPEIVSIITSFSGKEEALEVFAGILKDYITIYPSCLNLRHSLGLLCLKLRRLQDAESNLRKAVQMNPKFVRARIDLLTALKEQGKYREALNEGELIVNMGLPYADVYCTLSEVLLAMERHDEALFNAKKALEIRKTYPRAESLLARMGSV